MNPKTLNRYISVKEMDLLDVGGADDTKPNPSCAAALFIALVRFTVSCSKSVPISVLNSCFNCWIEGGALLSTTWLRLDSCLCIVPSEL